MKKLLSIILALIICLSFAACSTTPTTDNESETNTSSKITNTSSEITETSSNDTSSVEEISSTVSVVSKASSKVTTTSKPVVTSSKPTLSKPVTVPVTTPSSNTTSKSVVTLSGLYLGTTTASKWESKSFKLGFNLLSGWESTTKEDIAEINNLTVNDLSKDIALLFKDTPIIYDVIAADANNNSINILYEQLNDIYKNITVDEYLNVSAQNIEEAFNQMGYQYVSVSKSNFTFIGKNTPCIEVAISHQGQSVYEIVVCKKSGNYMCCITIASPDLDTLSTITDCFFGL